MILEKDLLKINSIVNDIDRRWVFVVPADEVSVSSEAYIKCDPDDIELY